MDESAQPSHASGAAAHMDLSRALRPMRRLRAWHGANGKTIVVGVPEDLVAALAPKLRLRGYEPIPGEPHIEREDGRGRPVECRYTLFGISRRHDRGTHLYAMETEMRIEELDEFLRRAPRAHQLDWLLNEFPL